MPKLVQESMHVSLLVAMWSTTDIQHSYWCFKDIPPPEKIIWLPDISNGKMHSISCNSYREHQSNNINVSDGLELTKPENHLFDNTHTHTKRTRRHWRRIMIRKKQRSDKLQWATHDLNKTVVQSKWKFSATEPSSKSIMEILERR